MSKLNISNLTLLLGPEPGRFWWGVVLVIVIVVVTGVKQSQLLDLSLGLGLEFDKNELLVKNIRG